MKKRLAIFAGLAALASPLAADAQVTLGLRLGYGFGAGDAVEGVSMSDWTKGSVPLQADLLFAVTPQLKLGAYGSYGWGQLGNRLSDQCDAYGRDCSASIVRLGVQATSTFAPQGTAQPWIGLGTGYEWNTADADGEKLTFKGWEILNVQAGADWKVSGSFSAGPFFMWGMGQYADADSSDGDIPTDHTTIHHWLQVGLRGTVGL